MVSLRIFGIIGVIVFAWGGLQPSPAAASEADRLLPERLEASRPDWFPDLEKCPADVMPARETKLNYSAERCAAALESCVDSCRTGDANACYAAALVLQRLNRESSVSEALFLKACTLGIVSGCTNRAAGMDRGRGTSCAVQTFEKACDRDDPWACTMMGYYVASGVGVAKNPKRAGELFAKSCRLDADGDACRYAKNAEGVTKD